MVSRRVRRLQSMKVVSICDHDDDDDTAHARVCVCALKLTTLLTSANLAPTAIALSSTTYPPNSPLNTFVANLSATDINSGEIFTYAITSATPANTFQITSGNRLSTATALLLGNNLSITIRVTDSRGLTFSSTFSLSEGLLNHFSFSAFLLFLTSCL